MSDAFRNFTSRFISDLWQLWLFAVCFFSQWGAYAAEPVWNAFAGRNTVVIRNSVAKFVPGERLWFRVSKEGRTISSGTARIEADGSVALAVNLPEMKPGVALPFEVVLRDGSDQGLVAGKGTLWVFAEQPFESGHKLCTSRNLLLYDPEGRTEAAFRKIGLICEPLSRLEALEGVTNAVIIVGEGASLERERGLSKELAASVARGCRVLLLAPCDGQFKPPERWSMLVAGDGRKVLDSPSKIGRPYKLDLAAWPSDGRAVQQRFQLSAEREALFFKVSQESGCEAVGWDDTSSGGRFLACGYGIIAKWDETPAARWLLVDLIEGLAKEECGL